VNFATVKRNRNEDGEWFVNISEVAVDEVIEQQT